MNFRVFAAFFVTLLAVHASSQSPLKDDSIKAIVLEVFGKVLEVTGSALEKVNTWYDGVITNEDDIKAKINALAVKEANEINNIVMDVIDSLKDGATDDETAVIACLNAEHDKTVKAFEDAGTDIGNCVGAELDVALPELKTIIGQLNDLQADIQGQIDTLSACSDEELTCLSAFVGTIFDTLNKIPTVIKEDVQQVIELVKTVISDLKGCDYTTKIKANVKDIFSELTVCVKS